MFCPVLESEKQFMEAAKLNDVESMRKVGRGLNVNAKNVVGRVRENGWNLEENRKKGE